MAKTRQKINKKLTAPQPSELLAWYDKNGRDLPWRSHDGRAETAYHTWIAEIMLQQTTVATVIPYYLRFIKRWPTVTALAKAQEQSVLKEWAGLGYYSRARNLLKCAKTVATEFNGEFPSEIEDLKSLPGIGDYTSNAIRAIAFDKPANVVDGNVERVVSRVFGFEKPLNDPANKKEIKKLAETLVPIKRPGDYAQALMDLGATVCTPKNPACDRCPWQKNCIAFATGKQNGIPVINRAKKNPERFTTCLVTRNKEGKFYLVQRPATGLLGGLWEFPSTPWSDDKNADIFKNTSSEFVKKPVTHVFSHFKLTVTVRINHKTALPHGTDPSGKWVSLDKPPPLSTLTRKIWSVAEKHLGEMKTPR